MLDAMVMVCKHLFRENQPESSELLQSARKETRPSLMSHPS